MTVNNLRDGILYHRIKRQDKDAFIKSYDLYYDEIYRFVFFKVNNSREVAQDISSQTFLKAWNYIQNNNVADYKTLKSLFYKIARNLVIDYYRSSRNEVSIDSLAENEDNIHSFELVDEKQNIKESFELKDDFEKIKEDMKKLKADYREIISLRYINELSITEIADLLKKSKGNIRILIYRALKALKKINEK